MENTCPINAQPDMINWNGIQDLRMNIDIEQIKQAEDQLIQAIISSDVEILDTLLDESLLFTNHLGMLLRKQDDLDAHRNGIIKIVSIRASDQRIELFNDTAVVNVVLLIDGSYQEQRNEANFRFTRVWKLFANNKLRLIAAHSCLLA